jgi:hypothetical protein
MGVFFGVKFAQKGFTPLDRKINKGVEEFRKSVREVILKRLK